MKAKGVIMGRDYEVTQEVKRDMTSTDYIRSGVFIFGAIGFLVNGFEHASEKSFLWTLICFVLAVVLVYLSDLLEYIRSSEDLDIELQQQLTTEDLGYRFEHDREDYR